VSKGKSDHVTIAGHDGGTGLVKFVDQTPARSGSSASRKRNKHCVESIEGRIAVRSTGR
jgi:hypothetical protein